MNKLHHLKTLAWVLAGNLVYALAVQLFILPNGLITGGTTGIALVLQHFFGLPISPVVLGINIAMLLVGLAALGKAFVATTLVSTFAYPLLLQALQRLLGGFVPTHDLTLSAIFGGLGIGLGLGLVIRSGASTGGMDIPPLVLYKLLRVPVSASLYAIDFCILLGQCFYQTPERVLYGVLVILAYTIVLDRVVLIGTTRTEVKIVSHCAAQIRDAILLQADRGVTMIMAEGGYMHQPTQMIFSVISDRELPKVEKLAHAIDPECFMVVTRVSEVQGRGFTLNKHYAAKPGGPPQG